MDTPLKPTVTGTWPKVKDFVLAVGSKWGEDNVPRLAAAFSFFAILSLAPTLVLAVAAAGLFYGRRIDALHDLLGQAGASLGKPAAALLGDMIKSAMNPRVGTFAALTSIVITFFSASNLFLQLDDAIRTIWGVKASGSMIKNLVKTRVVAFVCVLAFGAALIAWLGFDSWITWLENQAGASRGFGILDLVTSVVFLALVFAATYKGLAKQPLKWRDVVPGAIVAGIGIVATKLLLSVYLSSATVSSAYGSAGALIVVLLWLFYTAQIFFFGVEVTCIYAVKYGSLRAPPY